MDVELLSRALAFVKDAPCPCECLGGTGDGLGYAWEFTDGNPLELLICPGLNSVEQEKAHREACRTGVVPPGVSWLGTKITAERGALIRDLQDAIQARTPGISGQSKETA